MAEASGSGNFDLPVVSPNQFKQLSFNEVDPTFNEQVRKGSHQSRMIPMRDAALRAGSDEVSAGWFADRIGSSRIPMAHVRQFEHAPSRVSIEGPSLLARSQRVQNAGTYDHLNDVIKVVGGFPDATRAEEIHFAVHELGHALHMKSRGPDGWQYSVQKEGQEELVSPHLEGVADGYSSEYGMSRISRSIPGQGPRTYRETGLFKGKQRARYESARSAMEAGEDFPPVIPRDIDANVPLPEKVRQLPLPGASRWGVAPKEAS